MKKFVTVVLVLSMVFLVGCGNKRKGVTSTDVTVVKNLFPNIIGISGVEVEICNNTDEALLSPECQFMTGYIYLTDDSVGIYNEQYEWKDANPIITLTAVSDELYEHSKWMYSEDFNQKMFADDFIGNIWFNGKSLMFYGGIIKEAPATEASS